MANVSLCTVCVILIVLYKPEALCLNIDRSLCLETIIKFMHDQHKCGFSYEHADELLKDYNVTCQTECQVTLNAIYLYNNCLEKVKLGFGNEIYEHEPCRWPYNCHALNMKIACLAWNKVKVPIGGYCKKNEQCHGSENSGVCEHHRCVCKTEYILSNFECHEGNLSLNQTCSFSEQCSGSPYASCLERKCSCIEGYTAEESNYCVPVKVQLGGYCTQNEQCQRSDHSGVCDQGRCVCRTGYIQYNLTCHEGNLSLNQPCFLNEQCSRSPYVSCLERKCSCIDGYTAEESNYCVPVKVPVGGYCTKNEQCHGSKNSGICDHGRCVCRDGYVLFNLECHEGNLALNQSCSFSEQCAGSPYASCLRGKCSCIEGYTAEGSTYCVQRNLVLNQTCSFSEQCTGSPYASCLGGKCSCIEGYTAKNVTSCIQSQTSIFPKSQHKEEANVGNTAGALFGGLLLGVILTTVAAVFTYRRSKTYGNKRDELNIKFSDNDAVVDPNAFQNIHTKDGKREVSLYSGSEETSMHNNVYEKLRNEQTQDDVHNHLYEQLK